MCIGGNVGEVLSLLSALSETAGQGMFFVRQHPLSGLSALSDLR